LSYARVLAAYRRDRSEANGCSETLRVPRHGWPRREPYTTLPPAPGSNRDLLRSRSASGECTRALRFLQRVSS
jgi:hypothetical protein